MLINESNLEQIFIEMFNCDTARISKYDKYYLIIGYKRRTEDQKDVEYYENGNRVHFEYVEEKVIASGLSLDDLKKSAESYRKLLAVSSKDYINSLSV